jgi:hypothetical protein
MPTAISIIPGNDAGSIQSGRLGDCERSDRLLCLDREGHLAEMLRAVP